MFSQGETETTDRRKVGSSYEKIAAAYLANSGYQILACNYRSRQKKEIDLIALEGDCLVFAEVKFRSDARKGDPAEAVNPEKQRRIRMAAGQYLLEQPEDGQVSCRFDVVGSRGAGLRLVKGAF